MSTGITFKNEDASEGAYFCWSTTAPASLTSPTCPAMGSAAGGVSCTAAAVPATDSSSATDVHAPILTSTTTLYVWACDAAVPAVRTPSAVATAAYTFQVATPTVGGIVSPISIGQSGRPQHRNGRYRQRREPSPTPRTGRRWFAAPARPCPARTAPPPATPTASTATYSLAGNRTVLNVAACKTGYSQSTTVAAAGAPYTFSAPTPVFAYATSAGYDDVITQAIQVVATANTSTWLCYASAPATGTPGTPQCGSTLNSCNETSVANSALSAAACAAQPNGTALTGLCTTLPVPAAGLAVNAISCTMTAFGVIQTATPVTSTVSYTISGLTFTPASGPAITSAGPISPAVSLTPSAAAPNGNGTTSGTTAGATICWTTASATNLGNMPTTCPAAGAAPAIANPGLAPATTTNWTCGSALSVAAGTTSFTMATDVGAATNFYAFACKTGLPMPTTYATAAYTVGSAYSSSITFTAAVTDFNATQQMMAGTDGSAVYVSWDSTNLYIGYNAGAALSSTSYVEFYVGDSGTLANTGTTVGDSLHVNDGKALPATFNALFHVYFLTTAVSGSTVGIDAFNGTAWVPASGVGTNMVHANGSTFFEISVPRASIATIGTPANYTLLGGAFDPATSTARGVWPSAAGNVDSGNWIGWQKELTGSAFFPNDATNYNK